MPMRKASQESIKDAPKCSTHGLAKAFPKFSSMKMDYEHIW